MWPCLFVFNSFIEPSLHQLDLKKYILWRLVSVLFWYEVYPAIHCAKSLTQASAVLMFHFELSTKAPSLENFYNCWLF